MTVVAGKTTVLSQNIPNTPMGKIRIYKYAKRLMQGDGGTTTDLEMALPGAVFRIYEKVSDNFAQDSAGEKASENFRQEIAINDASATAVSAYLASGEYLSLIHI